jgi:hypothetical protein
MGLVLNIFGWIVRLAVVLVVLALMSSCTMLGLNYASLDTDNKPDARPVITAKTLGEWEAGRADLLKTFETFEYGPWPSGLAVELIDRRMINPELANGAGTLEELAIRVGSGEGARLFHVALALPAGNEKSPLIISQSFSSNCEAFPGEPLTAPDGGSCKDKEGTPVFVTSLFGEFIALVPIDQYFSRGYGYASWLADELIPDRNGDAQSVMMAMTGEGVTAPTGAVAGWGVGMSAIIDVLEGDPAIDQERLAAMGHSRHGKSALVAGVYDRRIAAVVAHQSGFGGAASSRSSTGETVKRMIHGARAFGLMKLDGYPHWFNQTFVDYANHTEDLPVDQHQYLALLAPTPVFLGNGRRDVWSDPNSTYRMAEGADRVYELYGTDGLDQSGMQDFNPAAAISYYIRPGGHSITQQDITAFMDFLDAAMPQRNEVPADPNTANVSP